ncbi:MAG TPA: PQQ-binding-like beta-propeller repeat protein [Bryobacteraceae bacterium]|jgi:alcohol dehydrogenase (cytochrome c)|nr:PQQ-binding-like beta-propeller repeat protein [Bryobacteraceae bacterium]
MKKTALLALTFATAGLAQVKNYVPVTKEMLLNPSPNDWLMYSRTYDAQRFSPLREINRTNVNQLRMTWTRGMGAGNTETIPIVHNGVMYVVEPGAIVQALDATNGDLLWEYKRKIPAAQASGGRTKALAIYQDIVLYTAPDGFVVGLDARTGEQRWQTSSGPGANTSGPIVVEGNVISGRGCGKTRDTCFIAAMDALTGKDVWKFYNVPAPGEPGSETWGTPFKDTNLASTWGLPGTYDPVRKQLYWGIANAMPNTRIERHGSPDGTSKTAPADLYSNSTISLDPATGKLNWYYQHLPGDDWDQDYTHERTLVRTKFNPDPKFVKWINPDVKRGEERDMAVMVGEGGGIFALDRGNGQFLWATPFPYDDPAFLIRNIDVKTGKTEINYDLVNKKLGERHTICFYNTRSFWPTAYSPITNSLYVPYIDNCLDMTSPSEAGPQKRIPVPQPGSDPNKLTAIGKINLSTGEITRIGEGRSPSDGSVLATAGDLIFHGDMNRRFRAFDAATGKQLWEAIVGGHVSVSTMSYAVNGKQYIAIMTGDGLLDGTLLAEAPDLKPPKGSNSIVVFSLPDKR